MFPDIANVLHIREALWRHKAVGTASIMVGAGFSRNAEPISPSAQPMPTWVQLAESLCDALYPTHGPLRDTALDAATGTSGFLRLAQEYHTAFGETALQNHIRGLVPDLVYTPGDLHKRLLRLRWADIFSTNWDTLLERARADVFDRDYDLVRTMGEIPSATRPRIVKLHGTFPAHAPFIFTEEDYRTYPSKFAPFVNLVQQAMMETIFCLLGFSGDDPNFLSWSGWIRDNLGSSAPRIYLVGWLELSNHRRRMLEARNVMPVDLSGLPAASAWPPNMRHRYAAEWFISALERGKPYSPMSWPSSGTSPPATPVHLGHVPENTAATPRRAPSMPNYVAPQPERTVTLLETVRAWRQSRLLYPGWIIAPKGIRVRLHHEASAWNGEFIRYAQHLSPWERLVALNEIAWRWDKALLPFPDEHEELARQSLALINLETRTVGGEPAATDWGWADVLDAAVRISLALVQNARRAGDASRFESALAQLRSFAHLDRDATNAAAYEECLWKLAIGDLERLLSLLDDWALTEQETQWNLRKAGLLSEMGEHNRACALLERTLAEIRKSRRRDIDDLRALSLEGWALFLAMPYTRSIAFRGATLPEHIPEAFERWRELGVVNCDASAEYDSLSRELEASKPRTPDVTVTKGFDLDYAGVTHHLAQGPSPTIVAAYQMVLLSEQTGIPPKVRHVCLFEEGMKAAARVLADDEPWIAIVLAMRMGSDDKLRDAVFSRTRVARLSAVFVAAIKDTLLRRVEFALRHLSDRYDGETEQEAASAIELLSRISVRLPTSDLHLLLNEAMSYFRSPIFRRKVFLGRPVWDLLRRVLESLPAQEVWNQLPALFSLPLPHEHAPLFDEQRWPEVAAAVPDWLRPVSSPGESGRAEVWQSVIGHLLLAARGPDKSNRKAAIHRLYELYSWKLLTAAEQRAFALALWTPSHLDAVGLPTDTDLRRWVLLILPEEQPGQARAALLNFVKIRIQSGDKINEVICDVGEILHQMSRQGPTPLELSGDVRTSLCDLVQRWAAHRPDDIGLRHPFARGLEREREAFEQVSYILPHITPSEDLKTLLFEKVQSTDNALQRTIFSFTLFPMLAEYRPDRSSELIDRLRRALVSDDQTEIRAGVQGLYSWITYKGTSDNSALDDLVREVGVGVAARRLVILRQGLELARWVFKEGPVRLRDILVRDCDHGLSALLSEASYDRTDHGFDVPEIRAASLRLARAMTKAGFGDRSGVKGWLAASHDDPLPEVRNAELR